VRLRLCVVILRVHHMLCVRACIRRVLILIYIPVFLYLSVHSCEYVWGQEGVELTLASLIPD